MPVVLSFQPIAESHSFPVRTYFESMAKIKSTNGYRFVKELGGAIEHQQPSDAASWLVENKKVNGRVLDYGCGHGFDADHFGWSGYDPYYRQAKPDGKFDTIICNHVLNMLTRSSRASALASIQLLLKENGIGWLVVPRNIPQTGKLGARKRIQNFVILSLPTIYLDNKLEIYQLNADSQIVDRTNEIESSF